MEFLFQADTQEDTDAASQVVVFQGQDGQYVDHSGNIVNLAAYGIDVSKGVELQVIPETQQNSQTPSDIDENSQSLLIPSTPSKMTSQSVIANRTPSQVSSSQSVPARRTTSQGTTNSADPILRRARSLLHSTGQAATPTTSAPTTVTVPSSSAVVFVGDDTTSAIPTFTSQVKKGKADYLEDHLLRIDDPGEQTYKTILNLLYFFIQMIHIW